MCLKSGESKDISGFIIISFLRAHKILPCMERRAEQTREVVQVLEEKERIGTVQAQGDIGIQQQLQRLAIRAAGEDPIQQLECVIELRKLLSVESNSPTQEVIDSGVVPRLVEFLAPRHSPALQLEAAWALTNITAGTSQHVKVVIDNGAVPLFVDLLRSKDEGIPEQVSWALGNIIGDSYECRDLVLRAGILQPLLALCVPTTPLPTLRTAAWALSNLCRVAPPRELAEALPCLAELVNLSGDDEEVLTHACLALSLLSENDLMVRPITEAGVCKRIVELLRHQSNDVKLYALHLVGKILSEDDEDLIRSALNVNALLPVLLPMPSLFGHRANQWQKEACGAIANITAAGNPRNIQEVIDAGLVPHLISILNTSSVPDVRQEASRAIFNAISGSSDEQVRYLVDQGVIQPLCDLLTSVDPRIIAQAMEAIEKILRVGQQDAAADGRTNRYCDLVKECSGLDKLQLLGRHDNEEMRDLAEKALCHFEGARHSKRLKRPII